MHLALRLKKDTPVRGVFFLWLEIPWRARILATKEAKSMYICRMRFIRATLLLAAVLSISACRSLQQAAAEIPANAPLIEVASNADIYARSAPFEVAYADFINDHLVLQVSYSGGCEDHHFEVISDGKYTATYPPEITLHIKHFDNGDRCRGFVDEKRYFDASTIQYPGTNRIRVVFAHNNRILDYIY